MKERPILFNGEMVRAILNGRKTQTRRVVKGCVETPGPYSVEAWERGDMPRCPYGQPGDRLWVRETWHTDESDLEYARAKHEDVYSCTEPGPIYYRATDGHENPHAGWRWRPSIHMPRWASRISLEVTGVRVERVQEITASDAVAEGCAGHRCDDDIAGQCGFRGGCFAHLWDSINAKRGFGWDVNPWVWIVEFKRIDS